MCLLCKFACATCAILCQGLVQIARVFGGGTSGTCATKVMERRDQVESGGGRSQGNDPCDTCATCASSVACFTCFSFWRAWRSAFCP